MKISKSLLQAIAVAVAVGVTQGSCTKIEEKLLKKDSESDPKCGLEDPQCNPDDKDETFDCPACGMG